MIITIAKINRTLREGISKKTGKPYSFESLGIAPLEDTLIDINGDTFERDGRWLNGSSVKGVTEEWSEGDKVKLLLIQKSVVGKDGGQKNVINFSLPEGVPALVSKSNTSSEPEVVADPEDY